MTADTGNAPNTAAGDPSRFTVLVVDDSPDDIARVVDILADRYEVIGATTWPAAREIAEGRAVDLFVLDYKIGGGWDGIEALDDLRRRFGDRPGAVVVSAFIDAEVFAAAEKRGARCIDKLGDGEAFRRAVADEVRRQINEREARLGHVRREQTMVSPVFRSPAMWILRERATSVMNEGGNVLVTGERGTGKGVLAAWLHFASPVYRYRPFETVAMPDLAAEIFEGEMFGVRKGAFTGAADRPGLVELVHRGTLVFDEIGELTTRNQAALLNFLETKRYRPLGFSSGYRTAEVRFISITNRNLARAVDEGSFRGDLHDRLRTFHLDLPPLRERAEDIPVITADLLSRTAAEAGKRIEGIEPALERELLAYEWPGNVRELANWIRIGVVACDGDRLAPRHLPLGELRRGAAATADARPLEIRGVEPGEPAALLRRALVDDDGAVRTLREGTAEFTRLYVAHTLTKTGGNVAAAAGIAGFARESYYRKIRELGLDPADFRAKQRGGDA